MARSPMYRRDFLEAGGLALASLGLGPARRQRAPGDASRRSRPGDRRKTLVCIFQRGAVDGLGMIIPHAEPRYYAERPHIAVPPPERDGGTLDLDGVYGLHPALAPLLPLYRAGTLAAVHAVGSPHATRSHFDAQRHMATGTPGRESARSGWLNRYLEYTSRRRDTPFRGVAIGPRIPRALRGTAPTLALANTHDAPAGHRMTASAGLSRDAVVEAARMLRAADTDRDAPADGASYPAGRYGRALRQVAQLIRSDLGVEIAFADIGGWDTHVHQGAATGALADRLAELGQGLAAFTTDLGGLMADVVVVTMSEFGRAIAENDTAGTDHGHATAMLVLGGETRGGCIYGCWPTLEPDTRFEGRDLAVTTDYRDLFAEVLVRHLGTAHVGAVFPGHTADERRWPGVLQT